MSHIHFLLPLLALFLLMNGARAVSQDNTRRNTVLKFGHTKEDYLMYKPDMTPMKSAFSVCAWVRKLRTTQVPTWFSYAVSDEAEEIEISDMGDRTYVFGQYSDQKGVYTVRQGNWFHNCLTWSAATQTRRLYINGALVNSTGTPGASALGQYGYLVIGNEQSGYGTGMDSYNTFAGELYKLNMFSKMLTTSEIEEMAKDRCSSIEEMYGATRHIRWEDILDVSRNGNVYEIPSGCGNGGDTIYTKLQKKLEKTEGLLNETISGLKSAEAELEKTEGMFNETAERLKETLKKVKELESVVNTTCPNNTAVTSHWDILYSDTFYGETLTQDRIEVVRNFFEKLELFVGVQITDKLIELFKVYFN